MISLIRNMLDIKIMMIENKTDLMYMLLAITAVLNLILILYILPYSKYKILKTKYIDQMTSYGNLYYFIQEGHKILMDVEDKTYAVIHLHYTYNRQLNAGKINDMGTVIRSKIGGIMKDLLNDNEIFAYLGNDEFVILKEYNRSLGVTEFIKHLELALQTRLLRMKLYNKPTMKYGILLVSDPNASMEKMVEKAKYAAEIAKEKKNVSYVFFDESLEQKLLYEIKLENMIGPAIRNHEFEIYLQPKVDIVKDVMVGAEALVRWNSDTGLIMPDKFIPVFEKNNNICELDMYIFEEVCKILRSWIDQKKPVVPISVNLSRNNIEDDSFIEKMKKYVDKYDIPVQLLEIELTESAFMENQVEIVNIMEKLKKAGFKLSMDDFGSGYSSLNLLAEMPVDVVKIDKGFLKHHNMLGKERIVVDNVVKMTKELGIDVICEGVETNEQAKFLKEIGCNKVQGYLYSKPLPLNKFERLMTL